MAEKLIPSEASEQIKLCVALEKMKVLYYAIPNGGRRDFNEACKFKRMGVQSGVPDLCIPVPRGKYHGMYIEMKRTKKSSVSDNQKYWIGLLNAQGYHAIACAGFPIALEAVLQYLAL
jgi:hypothetical protein